jgi:erythromycin esterase-like protein
MTIRREAGRQLSGKLTHYGRWDDVIVLAPQRGGVPVGYEVARALKGTARHLHRAQARHPGVMFLAPESTWNLRDRHMAETFERLSPTSNNGGSLRKSSLGAQLPSR